MSKIYFASDHHLGHKNIITFRDSAGFAIRPHFTDIEQHDEFIINKHNDVVKNNDLVYFLGDVAWKTNTKAYNQIKSMKGRKRICLGNHDDADWLFDTGLFERIYLWKYFPEHNLVASHVPMTSNDLKNGKLRNVHGHTHEKFAYNTGYGVSHGIHYNVSVEAISYKPIELDEILKYFSVFQ
jgi:calcineurin-like phosphoesterase family protein